MNSHGFLPFAEPLLRTPFLRRNLYNEGLIEGVAACCQKVVESDRQRWGRNDAEKTRVNRSRRVHGQGLGLHVAVLV